MRKFPCSCFCFLQNTLDNRRSYACSLVFPQDIRMLPLSGVTHNTWCLLSIYTDLLIIDADGTLIYAELLRTYPVLAQHLCIIPRIYPGFT
jgi:hypothetical protein